MDIRIIDGLVLLKLLWSHWCIGIEGFESRGCVLQRLLDKVRTDEH